MWRFSFSEAQMTADVWDIFTVEKEKKNSLKRQTRSRGSMNGCRWNQRSSIKYISRILRLYRRGGKVHIKDGRGERVWNPEKTHQMEKMLKINLVNIIKNLTYDLIFYWKRFVGLLRPTPNKPTVSSWVRTTVVWSRKNSSVQLLQSRNFWTISCIIKFKDQRWHSLQSVHSHLRGQSESSVKVRSRVLLMGRSGSVLNGEVNVCP